MKKYTKKQLEKIEKRIDHLLDFSLFIFKNPAILENVGSESHLILLPEDEIELAKENLELGFESAQKDKKEVNIFIGKKLFTRKAYLDINSKKEPELAWK